MRNVSRETYSVERETQHLVEGCSELGITISPKEIHKFNRYTEEITKWNRRINLVSRLDVKNIALYHYLDSLSSLAYIDVPKGVKAIDIGSGAGFPGVPMKICRPDLRFTLVESIRKKALFLRHIIEELRLSEVIVFCDRAERLNQKGLYRDRYDLVVSRAVTKLGPLVSLCLPFLKPGGIFVAYKGGDVEDEIQEMLPELSALSGRLVKTVEFRLPLCLKERRLFVFSKS
jgi:16S rRNA (guanine527-N7)-methyltransferase